MDNDELKPGSIDKIISDEHIVIGRCVIAGKKNGNFNFFPAIDIMPLNKNRRRAIAKKGIKISIMNIRTDAQSKAWKNCLENIVAGTCYQVSKCYTDRLGIANYYLNPDWRSFFVNPRNKGDWKLPSPCDANL